MVALENHADVFPLRMFEGVAVVFDVAGFTRKDCVVAAHIAVVTGEPVGAALAEDDVAGDHVFFCVNDGSVSWDREGVGEAHDGFWCQLRKRHRR